MNRSSPSRVEGCDPGTAAAGRDKAAELIRGRVTRRCALSARLSVRFLHMPDRQTEVLAELAKAAAALDRRDALIREGAALGISKVLLAQVARLSRRGIYDILERRP